MTTRALPWKPRWVTNWIYYGARGSALLAIVYHTAANAVAGFWLFPMFSSQDSARLWWLYAAVYIAAALVTGARIARLQRPLT